MSGQKSQRVISATFCLPITAAISDDQWDVGSRRGTSALFDALAYLSTERDHTVVGWTGEIGSKGEEYVSVTSENRKQLEKQLLDHEGSKLVPVWLFGGVEDDGSVTTTVKDQRRWRRYAEHELYTLFHYRQHEPTDGRAERLSWADYFRMNTLFADRIMEIYQPGDIVWIHDYHLLLLPSMLRQRLPKAHIGFYLHIPFPSSEFLRCLSRRKEILEGVLGSNLVGFQTHGYCRHFVSCCKRILHFESSAAGVDAYGAHVAVEAFPIGINAGAIQKIAFEDPEVEAKMHGIRELYHGRKVIVGRDRLDTVRGVAQKLQAFEIFLERYPQWRDKVVLIQVTSPTSVEEEKEDAGHKIANKVSELVSRINGKFGSLSFSPVQHYPQFIPRDEYFALLRIADVGLITSVRDGMNTTSLEYVVCQRDNYGPLILSEFSGTAGCLGSAIHINPWDLSGVASAIDQALAMPLAKRRAVHQKLYERVTTNTAQAWTETYLSRLASTVSSLGASNLTPALDKTLLLAQFRRAKRRLFMFDYDGTLTPIVKDPAAAIPSDKVLRNLKTLAADSKNSVWIISGRDQAFLDEWMGHIPELGLSAEHGSFIRHPMEKEWENVTATTDMSWQKEVLQTFQLYTEKTQGSFIERKKVALTWHYRRADPEYGSYQAKDCKKHLEATVAKKYEVEVMEGKANLEVRPRFVNKGEIAKRLIREYGEDVTTMAQQKSASGALPSLGSIASPTASAITPSTTTTPTESTPSQSTSTFPQLTPTPSQQTTPTRPAQTPQGKGGPPDFVLCLGDDFTDEDMFRALNASDLPRSSVFACTVGASSKQTLAQWHLLEPSDVINAVGLLNGSGDGVNEAVMQMQSLEVVEAVHGRERGVVGLVR